MLHRMRLFYLLALGIVMMGCSEPCEREACEEIDEPAHGEATPGIVGAIASESDVVTNGCQPCSYSSTTLELWATSSPIETKEAAKTLVEGASPTVKIEANSRYSQPMTPGNYLMCTGQSLRWCVNVDVGGAGSTTVHVKLIFGPTQFIVFAPGSNSPQRPSALEVYSN